MAKKPLVLQQFHGGQASDLKLGPVNSFYRSRHLDFRKSPTQLTILPRTVKETGTTVTDLITELVQLPSGMIVAIDESGGVYTRSTLGVWAKNGTTLADTAHGMFYNLQQDTIYIPGLSNMHSITNADGRFGGSFTVNSNAFTAQVDLESANGHAQTYSSTGSVSETAANKLEYTPTIEPLYSFKTWVTTKGSGDLVLVVHDGANNVLATTTLANGSITNGAYNEFVFTDPVRMTIGATYHFHIYHASGTAHTIGTSTTADFSTADYKTLCNYFVEGNNGFHPAEDFLQYMLIGHERYVAAWEVISQTAPNKLEFLRHRLTFPSGYEVTSMASWGEYKVIACEIRSTSANIELQKGKLFFWDGISSTYDKVIDIPEGAPYSIFSQKDILYWYAGGSWFAWSGGNPVKLQQMPNTDFEYSASNNTLVVYPHMMAVRNSILMGGFPSQTSNTNIEHGVYSFGSRDRGYAESFGYSYSISTGSRTNGTLRIGCIKSFGDKLFISWQDDTSYGVDVVDSSSQPFTSGFLETLVLDDGRPDKTKQADELIITFEALPSGATLTPKYKIDRGSWVLATGTGIGDEGDTSVRFNINKRYKEIQVGFDLVATATTPVVTSIVLMRDLLEGEQD